MNLGVASSGLCPFLGVASPGLEVILRGGKFRTQFFFWILAHRYLANTINIGLVGEITVAPATENPMVRLDKFSLDNDSQIELLPVTVAKWIQRSRCAFLFRGTRVLSPASAD